MNFRHHPFDAGRSRHLTATVAFFVTLTLGLLRAQTVTDPGATTVLSRYMRVAANRLNVRAKAGVNYEVVCQLRNGTVVQIAEESGDWLGIYAPEGTEGWVAVSQLVDGRVAVERTPIYSGPGAIFTAYAELSVGDPVALVRVVNDQWAQIRPPANTVVWIHKSFVRAVGDGTTGDVGDGPDKPDDSEPAAAAGQSAVDEAAIVEEYVEPLPFAPLYAGIEFIGRVRKVVQAGVIVPVGRDQKPFEYALAVNVNSTHFPLAYVAHETMDLSQWRGKRVQVAGNQQWMRGRARPLIRMTSIEEIVTP